VSNVVRSKEELHKGFGSLLELQKRLFQEYLEAEGLGLYDEVPSFKASPCLPTTTCTKSSIVTADPKPVDDDADLGPDPFDHGRKHYLDLDHETLGFLAMLR
jgi:hypothetical protein